LYYSLQESDASDETDSTDYWLDSVLNIIGAVCSFALLEIDISPLEYISTYQRLWGITFRYSLKVIVYSIG
jgi:hypothetical protein